MDFSFNFEIDLAFFTMLLIMLVKFIIAKLNNKK